MIINDFLQLKGLCSYICRDAVLRGPGNLGQQAVQQQEVRCDNYEPTFESSVSWLKVIQQEDILVYSLRKILSCFWFVLEFVGEY